MQCFSNSIRAKGLDCRVFRENFDKNLPLKSVLGSLVEVGFGDADTHSPHADSKSVVAAVEAWLMQQ